MGSCKVVSYNVKGLHNPIKRKKILNQLKQMKCDIAFLQETHLSKIEHDKLNRSWVSQVYHSSHPSGRKKGVAVLINRSFNFCIDSRYKDKDGRYVLVNGSVDGVALSLLNVYAPNENCPLFFKNIFDLVLDKANGVLLVGGDFNLVLNPLLDKSSTQTLPYLSTSSRALQNRCEELGLTDVWRHLNPKTRDYTFYSHPHLSYSRIDYFFTPKTELYRITHCQIHNITLSDHAPISLTWNIGRLKLPSRWRLNTSLLGTSAFKDYVRQEFVTYLQFNDRDDTSPVILWEAAKAVLRGKIIQFASRLKRERISKQKDLEEQIKDLERQHKISTSTDILNKLKQVKQELENLLTEKVERNVRYLKQKYYEHGNRASRLLASQLRKKCSSTIVQKIKNNTPDNSFVHTPNDISDAFAEFYKDLYSDKDTDSNPDLINAYLNIQLPKLDENASKNIDKPITKQEIVEAIGNLKNNKSPGTDGFSNEFYKTFVDIVSPILERVFSYALVKGELPSTWKEAIISVLLKERKDPTLCASYRPIALLNTDCKILTSILAKRVGTIITDLIHPDQTGFISGRYLPDNIRRLLNIMEQSKKRQHPCMVLAVDAQKAFDRVSWPFLFKTLEKFGFGPKFIGWIKLLYSAPQSLVRVNGHISNPFTLHRGTRQGCPLSPLLFALFIEPLAQTIREDKSIKGIEIGGEVHKISLYADDVLVYISEPLSSVPRLMQNFTTFGKISGYKVNVNKTEALAMNTLITQQIRDAFSFKWPKDGITYLGTTIPQNIDKLFDANFSKLINKISADLDRWNVLPLSLSGRIECIRMNVLPKLLFLFQALPLVLPNKTFTTLDRHISRFIWQGKKPRVRYKLLQLPKSQGGWGLPNLKKYWWACQLRALIVWMVDKTDTRWLEIEKNSCSSIQLSEIPFTSSKDIDDSLSRWSKTTLKAWREVQKSYNLPVTSGLSSIAHLRDFIPLKLDSGYKKWKHLNLNFVHQLLGIIELKSFEELMEEFNIPKTDFFRYLQIRSFLTKHPDWDKINRSDTSIEKYLVRIQTQRCIGKPISILYKIFSSMAQENNFLVKERWEKEFGMLIMDDIWENISLQIHKVTNANIWREFQWKIVHKFFRTPHIISKFNPLQSGACWRACGEQCANHLHIFWSCPVLNDFWKEILDSIDNIFSSTIVRGPFLAILGAVQTQTMSKKRIYLLHILLAAAKKSITLSWLKVDPPRYDTWLDIVRGIYTMEKITFKLRLQEEQFQARWSPWLRVIEGEDSS